MFLAFSRLTWLDPLFYGLQTTSNFTMCVSQLLKVCPRWSCYLPVIQLCGSSSALAKSKSATRASRLPAWHRLARPRQMFAGL